MPQKRNKENRSLPPRWRILRGKVFYKVPQGQEHRWDGKKTFKLGNSLPEAYRVWAERMERHLDAKNIGQLLDRYLIEVVPKKAPQSQKADIHHSKKLRGVFGHMSIFDLEPKHVYLFYDKQTAKVSARRQIALLSHAFTMAVQWGYISRHPFKGEIRLEGEKPRTRYVEDWEVLECLSLPAMRKSGSVRAIQAYIRLKLLTGLRRGDLLRLQISDFTDEGLRVETSKTGKPIMYAWDDSLRAAYDMAIAARPVDIAPYLFCTRRGRSYVDSRGEAEGWASMWQRFMARVKKETKVTEHFTDHDLRAKVASDAESLERAKQLLAHADSRLTQRVYRRKAEIVSPAKSVHLLNGEDRKNNDLHGEHRARRCTESEGQHNER